MESPRSNLSNRDILYFWIPLSATWLMMSVEGPFLSAVIARMAEPKFNLAAYGVAFSLALMVEAPIIMIMSASTALVRDHSSFLKMRRFIYTLNGLITFLMLVRVWPTVFDFIALDLIGLPERVAYLTHVSCLMMLPWPGAIGYRRFYQGILIRHNRTRFVAYGTVVRLSVMAVTVLGFYFYSSLEGAWAAAAALSAGVTAEALASRLMVANILRGLKSGRSPAPAKPLTYSAIINFYYPLALTTILALGVRPMVTFFIGQSRMALDSLAVLPVIQALVFIFMSFGFSYQEVGIALLGDNNENYRPLRNFAIGVAIVTVAALAVIGFTPASYLWLHHVSGLSLELTRFSLLPVRIMVLAPALAVLVCFQRAVLVNARRTTPITWATAVEVCTILTAVYITIRGLDLVGVVAATIAFQAGAVGSTSYQFPAFIRIVRRSGPQPGPQPEPA